MATGVRNRGNALSGGRGKEVVAPLQISFVKSEVLPQEECDVEIECATDGLPRGVYMLKLGLIREDGLWFENKGNEPATVDIELGLNEYPEDAKCLASYLTRRCRKNVSRTRFVSQRSR